MNYPTAGNSGPLGQGLNHAAPPSAGRAHPSQSGEPSLGHGLSPPQPVAQKFNSSVGPTHACQTAPSEHVGPPSLPDRLLLETSSRQISSTYLGGGGDLVWRLSYALLLLGSTLGSGHSRARSPSPGQHANIVLPYSPNTHYLYRANICKCEIMKQCQDIKSIINVKIWCSLSVINNHNLKSYNNKCLSIIMYYNCCYDNI